MACPSLSLQEPSIDADKLSYEIFSILESKFLFGYDNRNLFVPGSDPLPNGEFPSGKCQRGKVCILSIDGGGGGGGGGGIERGVLAGKALAHLEDAIQRISRNPEARICEFFDVAAGSGVGGVLAVMLFATKDGQRPLYRAEDAWKFLAERSVGPVRPTTGSGKFFHRLLGGRRRSQRDTTDERTVKEAFGEKMTLKETLKPILVPCYDMCSSAPFLFSRTDALESDSFNFRIWDVCHATLAEAGADEPSEMWSVDGKTRVVGVDGGLAGMSNPTAAAITHVLHNKEEFPSVRGVEDLIVVSIGVGPVQALTGASEKSRKWTRPMTRIAAHHSAALVDQAVSMAFGKCSSTNYVRIQATGCGRGPVSDCVAMAEAMLKQKNVESVLFGGERVSDKTNGEKFDWFAGEIVSEHEKRSCRIASTVAIKQAPLP